MPIESISAELHAVAPDTFPHLGIRIVPGRDFDEERDAAPASPSSAPLHRRVVERGVRAIPQVDWVTLAVSGGSLAIIYYVLVSVRALAKAGRMSSGRFVRSDARTGPAASFVFGPLGLPLLWRSAAPRSI
jgi:hypothetical protein